MPGETKKPEMSRETVRKVAHQETDGRQTAGVEYEFTEKQEPPKRNKESAKRCRTDGKMHSMGERHLYSPYVRCKTAGLEAWDSSMAGELHS